MRGNLLSFSGDFLETGISPVHYAREYRPDAGRPRDDPREGPPLRTPAVDDRRFRMPVRSCAPGTEGFVALGIAHVIGADRAHAPRLAAAGGSRDDLGAWSPEEVERGPGSTPTTSPPRGGSFSRNQPGLAIAGTAGRQPAPTGRSTAPPVALLKRPRAGNEGSPAGYRSRNRAQAFGKYGAEAALARPLPGERVRGVRAGTRKDARRRVPGWRSSRGPRIRRSPSRRR